MLIKSSQHCPLDETQSLGPPHSDIAITASPAVPITPIKPRGASRRGRREAVAAAPPRAVAMVVSRANPPTTEKLTENRNINISQFVSSGSC